MASLAALTGDLPTDLACTHCGDRIERGYLTASENDDTYRMDPAVAVCDACGWREVGATGCAPTLADFEGGDLLVRIEPDGDGLAPADITGERD